MNDKNSKVDSSLNLDQDFEDVDLEDVNDIFNWISSDDPLASIIEQSKLETLTDLGIKGGFNRQNLAHQNLLSIKEFINRDSLDIHGVTLHQLC